MVRILSNVSQPTPTIPKPWSTQDETQHFVFGGFELTYKIFGHAEESLEIRLPEHREKNDENRLALFLIRNGVFCQDTEFEIGVAYGFGRLTLSPDSELPDKISAVWHAYKRAVEEARVDALWDERGYYSPKN
ncbi:MAG: hypothetical protein UX89_C0022G0009 [Parcubacteria group bacterium GW2011_GWA2_47_16]|nr:MAG: hypothetical protein UX89_C0022G0009 [Parcubacteria group bacterium GW2011_GWA2_47_16]